MVRTRPIPAFLSIVGAAALLGTVAGCGDGMQGMGLCGNGVLEPGEECDDGNTLGTDACTKACLIAVCGDGVLREDMEQCDDGNVASNDGCSDSCRVENICGDGVLDVGEQCEDGNAIDTDACTNSCLDARCGDGIVWAGMEQCDDGNTLPGDFCGPTCMVEVGCGNDIVDPGEECDDANLIDTDACPTTCLDATCGDGFLWDGMEECDDGNTTPGDFCSATCTIEPGCGNGVPEAGEDCDDGNDINTDACLVGCINPSCGDGHVWDGVEECDDGNTTTGDGCDTTCTIENICAHDFCATGVALDSLCYPCVTDICATYPACCSTTWDSACVNAVYSICGVLCFCGDHGIDTGEACDDGNTSDGDSCSSSCELTLATASGSPTAIAASGSSVMLAGSIDATDPVWLRPSESCTPRTGTSSYYYDVYAIVNNTLSAQTVTITADWSAGGGDGFLHAYSASACLDGNDDFNANTSASQVAGLAIGIGETIYIVASTFSTLDAIGSYAIAVATD